MAPEHRATPTAQQPLHLASVAFVHGAVLLCSPLRCKTLQRQPPPRRGTDRRGRSLGPRETALPQTDVWGVIPSCHPRIDGDCVRVGGADLDADAASRIRAVE